MADVADYIKFGKNTNTDVKKQKLMREHFGPDFTLKRGTDTKYLNFDFKGTKKINSRGILIQPRLRDVSNPVLMFHTVLLG